MPTTDHRYQPNGEVHQAHNFEYADLATLQAASGFTSNDNRKLALVLDSNDLWILTDWSGPTWKKASRSAWIDDDGTEPTTAPEASGTRSIAIGDSSIASGNDSIASGNNIAAGDNTIVIGDKGISSQRTNTFIFAGASDTQRSQKSLQSTFISSTDATPVLSTILLESLLPDGLTTADYNIYSFKVTMSSIQHAGSAGSPGDACVKFYNGAIKLVSGTISILGGVSEIIVAYDTNAENWNLTFNIDDPTDAIQIYFNGELNKSIRTNITIEISELGTD